ncbi:MAG: NAD(P)H-dependent oxidoreductase [Bacteroidetes bacterium]|nr:NAD(P)H-dependent oxidoreductase [Bacteroidota bacterium]
MKEMLTPLEVMERMVQKLQNYYATHDYKKEGSIQFLLEHKRIPVNCYIIANKESLAFHQGRIDNPTVSVKGTFYNWLALAEGKLNPIFAVFTRKLVFKGDTSFFKVLPRKQLKNPVNVPTDPVTKFEKNTAKYWTKPKKVIILNASPRAEDGYTEFYLAPFIEGMKKHTEVEEIHLGKYKINPCKGCFSCWMNVPGECIYREKDDHHELADKIYQADLTVYAFPIYADGLPGILKNFLDRAVSRAYPYMIKGMKRVRHPRRFINPNHAMVVFSICGFFEMKNFDPVRSYFKALSHNRHTPVVGEIYRTTAVGIYGSPFHYKLLNHLMSALKDAGEQIVLNGKINRKTQKIITKKIKGTAKDLDQINQWWDERKGKGELNY